MFQPVIPVGGLAGWRFLQDTYDAQISAFSDSPAIKRNVEYFREKIQDVNSAEGLVSDIRLLTVALGAFGLEDDIANKFFITKMLEEGVSSPESFSNRFSDSRYQEFSAAFGFGPGELRLNSLSGFSEGIVSKYEERSFEVAIGNQDENMRIALNADRELSSMQFSEASESVNWFNIMGKPPLRTLFETVFQLPASFGQVDIDQQQKIFSERSSSIFSVSDPAGFASPDLREELIARYTALSQISNLNGARFSPAANALTVLRGF